MMYGHSDLKPCTIVTFLFYSILFCLLNRYFETLFILTIKHLLEETDTNIQNYHALVSTGGSNGSIIILILIDAESK